MSKPATSLGASRLRFNRLRKEPFEAATVDSRSTALPGAIGARAIGRILSLPDLADDSSVYRAPDGTLGSGEPSPTGSKRRTAATSSCGVNGFARLSLAPSLRAIWRKSILSIRAPPEIAMIGIMGSRERICTIVSIPSLFGMMMSVIIS
jgi:hypothetical protein